MATVSSLLPIKKPFAYDCIEESLKQFVDFTHLIFSTLFFHSKSRNVISVAYRVSRSLLPDPGIHISLSEINPWAPCFP